MFPAIGLVKDDSHRTRGIMFEDGREISLRIDLCYLLMLVQFRRRSIGLPLSTTETFAERRP